MGAIGQEGEEGLAWRAYMMVPKQEGGWVCKCTLAGSRVVCVVEWR